MIFIGFAPVSVGLEAMVYPDPLCSQVCELLILWSSHLFKCSIFCARILKAVNIHAAKC